MFDSLKNRIAFWFINFGIGILSPEFRTEKLIRNAMKTGHIKVSNVSDSSLE